MRKNKLLLFSASFCVFCAFCVSLLSSYPRELFGRNDRDSSSAR